MRTRAVLIPRQGQGELRGMLDIPEGLSQVTRPGVVLAHGAANDMQTPLLVDFASGLAQAGYPVLRFNFPYRDAGRKTPDNEKVLGRAWKAACGFLESQVDITLAGVVAAGKSLGGRIASQEVAAGMLEVKGLIFLGYPLHAPGRTHSLRDAHLDSITCPLLFIEGSRDPFCDLTRLSGVIGRLKAPCTLEVIEGGEHSYRLARSTPEDEAAVHARIVSCALAWLERLDRGGDYSR